MTDSTHKGAVKSDGPLGRLELDRLLEQCQPAEGQSLQLGCPECQSLEVGVAYGSGMLVIVCNKCQRRLAVIVIAGSEHGMLVRVLELLDAIRLRIEDRGPP